jgi:hypothetical protein
VPAPHVSDRDGHVPGDGAGIGTLSLRGRGVRDGGGVQLPADDEFRLVSGPRGRVPRPRPLYFALLTLTEAEAQHPPAAGGLGAVEGAEKGSWAAARLTMRGLIGVVVAREALPGTPGCSAGYCLLLRFGRSRLRSGCRGVEDR